MLLIQNGYIKTMIGNDIENGSILIDNKISVVSLLPVPAPAAPMKLVALLLPSSL